tara:strand:- start:2399 stop:2803 length:405 start_codon:yes stop_codon:yes gene_type:complete
MPFNVPYCNITSKSTTELGNDSIANNGITPTHTLVITSIDPNLYAITPNDFRVVGATETGFGEITYTNIQHQPDIDNVTFVTNANNSDKVDVNITLVGTFAMNDQNHTINICIEGSPTISTTVTGNIFNVTTSL